jgi:hypothetical protein
MLAAVAAQTTALLVAKVALVATVVVVMDILALLPQLLALQTLAAVVVVAVKIEPQRLVALALSLSEPHPQQLPLQVRRH